MVRWHLRLRPTFFDADFCSGSVWELSWGAKSLLTASAESVGNPFNHSLASKYEFVLWDDGISIFTPALREWKVWEKKGVSVPQGTSLDCLLGPLKCFNFVLGR